MSNNCWHICLELIKILNKVDNTRPKTVHVQPCCFIEIFFKKIAVAVLDNSGFLAQIWIQIYFCHFFFCKNKYKLIWVKYKYILILFFRQIWIQIYLGLPKMGKYEFKNHCMDPYVYYQSLNKIQCLMIWFNIFWQIKYIWVDKKRRIKIRIYLVLKRANTNTNIFRSTKEGQCKDK